MWRVLARSAMVACSPTDTHPFPMADHVPEPSSHELYVQFRDRARQPAKGVIQGPDHGWRPSRRTIKPTDERDKADYLVHATNSRVPVFTGERGGDGSRTKFTRGFHRRQGLGAQQARERAARESHLEARRTAHDAKRQETVALAAYVSHSSTATMLKTRIQRAIAVCATDIGLATSPC